MDKAEISKDLIRIVREDSNKALGCTEPLAVAYGANLAGKYIDKARVEKLDLVTSKNIYKNGKSVAIPNSGSKGLDLAAGLGLLTDQVSNPYEVFAKLDSETIAKAKELIEKVKISLNHTENVPDIFIYLSVESLGEKVEVIISQAHTHVEKIIKNDQLIYEDRYKGSKEVSFDIKGLSFADLAEIIDGMDFEDLAFTLEGVDVNVRSAQEGLKGYGGEIGKTLNELKNQGVLADNFITETRVLTAAAADMRMGGGDFSIMTSGGSGNQGIGVILPVYMTAVHEGIGDERLARALFFAHVINRYVKEYSGKLSGMCGCAIGSAVGASAAIAYMLGGGHDQITGSCINVYADITGIICDGAKESCSMKLSTSAEVSIISAYLALKGVISELNVGVIGHSIEETIMNIGKLSQEAFTDVDEVVLDIIQGS